MLEMFTVVLAQIRGLNLHTKPAATTACDTFPFFLRTVSSSTAHGLREGVWNPTVLWIASCHIPHSFLTALVTPPCTAQFHVPSDAPRGCPSAGQQHLNAPRAPGTHPQWDSTSAAQILWQHAKRERTSWGKVLQDQGLERSRKEKPLDKQQQRERKRSETTGTPITTVRVI